MCESSSKTSLVAIASKAIDYIGVSTDYSCYAIACAAYAAYALEPAGTGYLVSRNIEALYGSYANARYDDCGFMHIHNWYGLSGKEQLDYRTEMLYYFYMARGAMDGVM